MVTATLTIVNTSGTLTLVTSTASLAKANSVMRLRSKVDEASDEVQHNVGFDIASVHVLEYGQFTIHQSFRRFI
jgi:hypothetical protein